MIMLPFKRFICKGFAIFAAAAAITLSADFLAVACTWQTVIRKNADGTAQTNNVSYPFVANNKYFLLGSAGSGNVPISWAEIKSAGFIRNDAPAGPWFVPTGSNNFNPSGQGGSYYAFAYNKNHNMYLMLSSTNDYAYSKDLNTWTTGTIPSGIIPANCSTAYTSGANIVARANDFVTIFGGYNCTTNKYLLGTISGNTIVWTAETMNASLNTPMTAKNWYLTGYTTATNLATTYFISNDGDTAWNTGGGSSWNLASTSGSPNPFFCSGGTCIMGHPAGVAEAPYAAINDYKFGYMTATGNYYLTNDSAAPKNWGHPTKPTGTPLNIPGLFNMTFASNDYVSGLKNDEVILEAPINYSNDLVVAKYRTRSTGGIFDGIYWSDDYGRTIQNWVHSPFYDQYDNSRNPIHDVDVGGGYAFGGGNWGTINGVSGNKVQFINLTRCKNFGFCPLGEGMGAGSTANASYCSPCLAGWYSDDNSTACKKCDTAGANSSPTYIHGGTGLSDRNMCKINCNAGQYAPAPTSGNPTPACTCCPSGHYCNSRAGYAYTGTNNTNPPAIKTPNDSPLACPAGPAGSTVVTDGAPNCPSLETHCYANLIPHAAPNCEGTKTCNYTNSSVGYTTNCRNYNLEWCPSGFYYNAGINASDGICVGTDYYRSSTDPVGQRTQCPQSPRKMKSGGCGLNAKTVNDCKPYVKLKHGKKTGLNDYIIMYNGPMTRFSPQMCTIPENDTLKYCANFLQNVPSATGDYSGFDVALSTGIKTQHGYLTNALPIVKDKRGFEITLEGIAANDIFSLRLAATGKFTLECGDGQTVTKTIANAASTEFACTYTSPGDYVAVLSGGPATGYGSSPSDATIGLGCNNSNGYRTNYLVRKNKMKKISGNLGKIFPVVNNNRSNHTGFPRFYQMFYDCTYLTGNIPANLFAGLEGTLGTYAPGNSMFYQTFYGTGHTGEIPGNLFAGINGAPASSMFYGTFSKTASVPATFTSIGDGLFDNITGTYQTNMFAYTFNNNKNLTGPSAKSNGQFLYQKWSNGGASCYGGVTSAYQPTGLSDWTSIPSGWK